MRFFKYIDFHTHISALLLGLMCQTAFGGSPETFFEDAIKYTVQVRTMIEMPFSGEEAGSFKGTGFVVDVENGWILTNAHIASRSPSRVKVAFKETDYFTVDKLYVDSHLDIALLKAPVGSFPKGVISAPLECEADQPVGHPVGAFGHPWSLPYTGTRGIISGSTVYSGTAWLQTDAPINNGNSGGPLISMQTGRLVGINTASVVNEKTENLNLAVSMKYVCKIIKLLHEGRDPSPPILPVRFLEYGDYHHELVVAETYFDGIDEQLKAGDVIYGVENVPDEIPHETHLIHLLRGERGEINLRIRRNGKELITPFNVHPAENITRRKGLYVSGLIIAPSGYYDESEINLGKTLMVHNTIAGTIANSSGIYSWDFIKTVDGRDFHTVEDLFSYLSEAFEQQRDVEIVVKRIFDTGSQLYSYKRISLPIENLREIGIQTGEQELASIN